MELSKPIAKKIVIENQYCTTSLAKIRSNRQTIDNHVLIAIGTGLLFTIVAISVGCVWRLYKKKYRFVVYGEEQKENNGLIGEIDDEKWDLKKKKKKKKKEDKIKVDLGDGGEGIRQTKKKRSKKHQKLLT